MKIVSRRKKFNENKMSEELNYYYVFSKYFFVLTLTLFLIYFTKTVFNAIKGDLADDKIHVKI